VINMANDEVIVVIPGKRLSLRNRQIVETSAELFSYYALEDMYKKSLITIMGGRIFKILLENATVYIMYFSEDDKLIIIRDDKKEVESIIKKTAETILREVAREFNFDRIVVKRYRDRISIKNSNDVVDSKFKAYELKPKLLPPVIIDYAESKLPDGKIAKEVIIPMKAFLNVIVFSIRFAFTESVEMKAKMLYEAGKSIREIAKDLNMTYSQVRYLLVKNNVTLRKREIPESIKEKVIELAKQGIPAYKIARTLDLNEVTVLNHLRKKNLVKRKKKLTQEEINMIVQMYKEGKSIYEIAKKLGRSTNLIVYYLKKLGIKN